MTLKNEVEYVVQDCFGVIYGFFETEGLAHQYLLEKFPNKVAKSNMTLPYSTKLLDRQYEVVRVLKEQRGKR